MLHVLHLIFVRSVGWIIIELVILTGVVTDSNQALAGQTVYTRTLTSLHKTSDGSDTVASITPGTKLEILQEVKDRFQVEITGWSPEGGEKYLFIAMNQRIRLAKIADGGMNARKVIAEKEDYYESVWQDVRLTGWVLKKDTVNDIAEIWKAARNLFHQRCTRCHALHRPTEFTANQWPSILKIMTVRAGLSAGKKALVIRYLQTHAKDQKGAKEVEKEQDIAAVDGNPEKLKISGNSKLAKLGAKLFAEQNCNACHGDDAATPVIPAYPKLASQSADYAFKQMQDFKSRTRANDQYEIMKESIAEVPEADMRAIAYWLSTL